MDKSYHRYLESLELLLPYGHLIRGACQYLVSGNELYLTSDVGELIAYILDQAKEEGTHRAQVANSLFLIDQTDRILVEYNSQLIGSIDAYGYSRF